MTDEAQPINACRSGRGQWTAPRVGAIALGGALGAGLRWAVLASMPAGRFPWPVLAVNVVGSFLLGLLMASGWAHPKQSLLGRDAGGIGFCGGFTTMSTFALDVADRVRDGHLLTAYGYVAASIVGGLLAVIAGALVLRRPTAVTRPLEDRP